LTRLLGAAFDNYEQRWSSLKPYLLLAGTAFLFNLCLSLSGFYDWNWDSWVHLFFSSHYMNSWFDTWELRWFAGFSVTSYPPLVTQLLALFAFPFGLGHAYALVSLGVMVVMPIAVFCFCSNFLSRQQATLAGFLSILLPSIYLTNYAYGQLPALFALMTSLFMGTFLWRYLEKGGGRYALIAALLVGITAASHHLTFICFIPLIVAAVSLTFLVLYRAEAKTFLKRLAIFGALSLPLALIPIFPFWRFMLEAEMQTPIPHSARVNLFTNSLAFQQFLLATYFLFLFALPLSIWAAYKHKYLIPLCAIAFFLFLLGLGGSTPLPRLIFGHWWQWLTYERFSLWAGVLFLPLLAGLIPLDLLEKGKKAIRSVTSVFLILVLLVMTVGAAYLASWPLRQPMLIPPTADLEPLLEFLDDPGVQQYRYITLGFGEAQMEKLSTLTQARNLDGSYYTGRELPVLRESGIATIDGVKFFDPELKVLDEILENASSYNLKWVFVDDVFYYDILEKHGFRIILSAEETRDSRLGSVTVWMKDNIPPIETVDKSEKGFWSYVWGIAPLLLVGALVAALLVRIRKPP
jgi:hypothetical protein